MDYLLRSKEVAANKEDEVRKQLEEMRAWEAQRNVAINAARKNKKRWKNTMKYGGKRKYKTRRRR